MTSDGEPKSTFGRAGQSWNSWEPAPMKGPSHVISAEPNLSSARACYPGFKGGMESGPQKKHKHTQRQFEDMATLTEEGQGKRKGVPHQGRPRRVQESSMAANVKHRSVYHALCSSGLVRSSQSVLSRLTTPHARAPEKHTQPLQTLHNGLLEAQASCFSAVLCL